MTARFHAPTTGITDTSSEDALSVHGRLARAASLLAVATVASRVLGLLREVVAAWLFGASNAKAAYVIAYYAPFFVQRLFLGGTLSIVFIPTISRYLARNQVDEAHRLSGSLFSLVMIAGLVMVAVGEIVAPILVSVAAPGFIASPGLLALAVELTRIIFPAMLFLALAVFVTGFLQAHQSFTTPALAPLLFNGTIIVGTLILGPQIGIRGLAIAWIAGTAAQFFVQLPAAGRYGLRLRATDLGHPAMREIARLALPAMLGLAIVEINAYVGRWFASLLPLSSAANPVAILDYAYEVVQAPAGIFAVSIATAVFPLLARHAAAASHDELRGTSSLALRTLLFVILYVTALTLTLREPLVRLLFQRGQFGGEATQAVAATLAGYTVGLPTIAAYYVVTRTYYALQDMATPVRIGGAMVILNAVLDYVLMRVWGVVGIALATSIVSAVNVCLLLLYLRRRLGRIDGRRLASTGWRTGAAAIASGALMTAMAKSVHPVGLTGQSLQVGMAAAAGALVYLIACRLLRVEEVGVTIGLLRRPARAAR